MDSKNFDNNLDNNLENDLENDDNRTLTQKDDDLKLLQATIRSQKQIGETLGRPMDIHGNWIDEMPIYLQTRYDYFSNSFIDENPTCWNNIYLQINIFIYKSKLKIRSLFN